MPFVLPRMSRLRDTIAEDRTVFDALLDSVDIAVVACDASGRVTHANRRAHELMAGEDPLGSEPKAWVERLRPRTKDGVPVPVDELPLVRAARGETVSDVDLHIKRERDEMILSTSANPVQDEHGRRLGAVVVFTDVTQQRSREAQTRAELRDVGLVTEIDEALNSDRISLFSQPVFDLRTGATVMEELLLRVHDTDGSVRGPGPFLLAAERYDTVTALDMWVLEHAVRVARGSRPVAINVSARTIGRSFFLETVEYLLERDSVAPAALTFEITESAVVSDIVLAARFAERLHDIGCNFALDDFGTGYAALTYLKNLPTQYLKIDREFVRDLPDNDRSKAVVAGIVSLAAGFGQRTIAEGVEREATLAALRELGVDMAQGFYLGEPAPIVA